MRIIALSLAFGLLTMVGDCYAGAGCCDEVCGTPDCCGACGAKCCCQKTCKVVCEMKQVKRTVWVVECEEFCTSLPNCDRDPCRRCNSCRGAKASCWSCCNDPCAALNSRNYVPPKCGKVRCRKKLVKKEITCEVPVYKCVVVFCCPGCDEGGEQEAPAPAPEQTTNAAPLPPLSYALTPRP